jgi:hypothetical protein
MQQHPSVGEPLLLFEGPGLLLMFFSGSVLVLENVDCPCAQCDSQQASIQLDDLGLTNASAKA